MAVTKVWPSGGGELGMVGKPPAEKVTVEGDTGGFLKDRRSALGLLAFAVGVPGCSSGLSEYWNWTVPDSTCFTSSELMLAGGTL